MSVEITSITSRGDGDFTVALTTNGISREYSGTCKPLPDVKDGWDVRFDEKLSRIVAQRPLDPILCDLVITAVLEEPLELPRLEYGDYRLI